MFYWLKTAMGKNSAENTRRNSFAVKLESSHKKVSIIQHKQFLHLQLCRFSNNPKDTL